MHFQLKPSKTIREFDASILIGKMVVLELQHLDKHETNQFASIKTKFDTDPELYGLTYISGWLGKVFGEKGEIIKRKITDAYLVEHQNGGRTPYKSAKTYKEFFNDEWKKEVQKFWSGGVFGRIMKRGGDADQADIIIKFKDCEIDNMCWEFTAPEEWYSEMFQDDPRFAFPKGFYKDADEAIHFFGDKSVDDMFGERYFPVVVFPIDTKVDVGSVVYGAKSHSKTIVTDKHIIIGTRCKPHEYADVMAETYEKGGQIARSQVWDWD